MATDSDKIDLIEEEIDKEINSRPRSATLLTLKWLAERVRKTSKIMNRLEDGDYEVDSKDLAKALLNKREQ